MDRKQLIKKQSRLKLEKERLRAKIIRIDEIINAIDRELDAPKDHFSQGPGVYILKCHDVYKIGRADNLRERLSNLQCGCPYTLEVDLFIPCSNVEAIELESSLHKRFEEKGFRGEWYRLGATDLKLLRDLHDGRGNGHLLKALMEFNAPSIGHPEQQAGMSWNGKMRIVLVSIRAVQIRQGLPGSVPISEVLSECERVGITTNEAQQILTEMRFAGDVFEPRTGYVKLSAE